jgi:hypothetical protein
MYRNRRNLNLTFREGNKRERVRSEILLIGNMPDESSKERRSHLISKKSYKYIKPTYVSKYI